MTTWALDIQRGWKWGLGLLAVLIAAAATMVTIAVLTPLSLLTFLLGLGAALAVLGAAYVGYLLWGLVHAVYALDRNGIYIGWGGYEYTIPLTAIEAIETKAPAGRLRRRGRLRWPGYNVGLARDEQGREYRFYATRHGDGLLWLHTPRRVYVISPQDTEGFLEALTTRREMGPTQSLEEIATYPAFFNWPIWYDASALSLFASTIVLLLFLTAFLCWRIPHLPSPIALQIARDGTPLLVAAPTRLFYLAVMGTLFLLLNGLLGLWFYRRERRLAYFLWSAMLFLQSSLWIALLSILWRV